MSKPAQAISTSQHDPSSVASPPTPHEADVRQVQNPSSGDRCVRHDYRPTEYKPWLVSDDAYGDPCYWWFIIEFNNIFDIEEFVAGITIQIPPLTYIG